MSRYIDHSNDIIFTNALQDSLQMNHKISHILFDLDGLLIDSESCYDIAYDNAVRRYGKRYDWQLKVKCMGLTDIAAATVIIEELGLTVSAQQLDEEVFQQFLIGAKNIDLMPGVDKLVRHLYSHNIPMSIATGATRDHFDVKVSKNLEFFTKHFDHHVLVSEDPNVKRGKPFPDVFIETIKKYESDVRPENVMVFEDSPLGIEAALAAGMHCIWVPDPRHDRTDSKATQVLNSLEEFEPQLYGLPAFG